MAVRDCFDMLNILDLTSRPSCIVHIVHIAQLQFIVHIYQYCTILPDIVREIQVALDRHGDDDQLGIRVRVPPGSAAAANDHDAEAGVYYGTSRT